MIKIKTNEHKSDWQAIRQSVFVEEQGFKNEFDDIDSIAHHVVLYVDDNAAGCGRTFRETASHTWHLGRLAILKEHRKQGYGAIILEHLEAYAYTQKGTEMILSAQQHAIAFYQKCGYVPFGEVYFDEHVPHQDMKKLLTK